jgi:hypothetical protein
MEIPRSSYFTDSKGRGFPGTVSNRTEQVSRQRSGMKPQDFTRSFTTHTGPRGRLTSTQVQTPTFSSERFIYPGGSGYETINGVERPIQLTGGGQDFMEAGIMNNPIVNTIKENYEKVEPYLPSEINQQVNPDVDFYGYEAPVGPGTMTFGTDKDFSNFYGGFKMNFDDGGIVDTPQAQDTIKKQLSDEQKDYLYDFMLDFMMKQKMREQQEMEGRVPMFNYFDMEV